MNKIPRIIHQTWKTEELPLPFSALAETWKEHNPGWEYKLWTDEMNRNLIKDHFPWFLERYDSYPREIQRVDAFRYFVLLKEGGLYVDVDFECLEPISPLLEDATCVLGKEPKLHCERFDKEKILCNAFMAAAPGNEFIHFVCQELLQYSDTTVNIPRDVLETTGPFILTNAYDKYKDAASVKILEPEQIYPITMFETKLVFDDAVTEDMQTRIDKSSAVHYFWGTW